jgi:hypothetical protein
MEGTDVELGSLEGWVAFRPGIFASTSRSVASFSLEVKGDEFILVKTSGNEVGISCHLQDFLSLHRDIVCLHPRLESLFPSLEVQQVSPHVLKQLQVYLEEASKILSPDLLLKLLSNQESDFFEEDIQELRCKSREAALEAAHKRLTEVVAQKSTAVTMMQTSCLWRLEDEAVASLLEFLAEKYTFQVIPFLREREFIQSNRKNNSTEQRDIFLSNSMALQQLYGEYHRKVLQVLSHRLERLLQDKSRFGVTSFSREDGPERVKRFSIEVSRQRITVFSVEKSTMELQRSLIKEDIKRGTTIDADVAEREYLESHLNVLDLDIKILNEEETLLKNQLAFLKNHDQDQEEVFFDALESLDQVSKDERLLHQELEEVRKRRAKTRNKISLTKSKIRSSLSSEVVREEPASPLISSSVSCNKNLKRRPSMTSSSSQCSLNRRSLSPNSVSIARLKAIKRVKEYRMKHPKDAETGEELPPFPEQQEVTCDDTVFPAPPSEFLVQTPNDDDARCLEADSSVTAKPPPPIIPDESKRVIPIPPPLPPASPPVNIPIPPPPPMPGLLIRDQTFKATTSLNKSSNLPVKASTTSLDLSQILEVRKSLKKTFPSEKSSSAKTDNPLLASLLRIREVRKDDSDDSDAQSNHSDFGD